MYARADHVVFSVKEKGKQKPPVLPPTPSLRCLSSASKKLVLENAQVIVMFHSFSIGKV